MTVYLYYSCLKKLPCNFYAYLSKFCTNLQHFKYTLLILNEYFWTFRWRFVVTILYISLCTHKYNVFHKVLYIYLSMYLMLLLYTTHSLLILMCNKIYCVNLRVLKFPFNSKFQIYQTPTCFLPFNSFLQCLNICQVPLTCCLNVKVYFSLN